MGEKGVRTNEARRVSKKGSRALLIVSVKITWSIKVLVTFAVIGSGKA